MADESSISFKFHVKPTPAISIKYKDKNDLYEKFLKEAKRHGFPIEGQFYASDLDGDIRVIRNADELLATLENQYNAKVYFPCPSNLDLSHPCLECDHEEKYKNEDRGRTSSERKKCSACKHSSSRRSVQCGSHKNSCPHYVMPWEYWTSFPYSCRYPHGYASAELPKCSNQICPCKDLSEGFEKL